MFIGCIITKSVANIFNQLKANNLIKFNFKAKLINKKPKNYIKI